MNANHHNPHVKLWFKSFKYTLQKLEIFFGNFNVKLNNKKNDLKGN